VAEEALVFTAGLNAVIMPRQQEKIILNWRYPGGNLWEKSNVE
jgi:hypothetical protein